MTAGTPTPAAPTGGAAAAAAAAEEYASLGRRALAALLDNLLWIIGFITMGGRYLLDAADSSPGAVGLIVVAYLTLWFNYFAYCERRWGQTAGKNATGLRVRRVDGSPLSWNAAAVRNLLRIVDFFFVGEILIATRKRKQRLGDLLAKTIVVAEPRRPAYGNPTPTPASPAPDRGPEASAAPIPGPAAQGPAPDASAAAAPPPAWYPDPLGHGYRWWDGSAWTARLTTQPLPPQPPGAPKPAGRWWTGIPAPDWSAGRVGLGVVTLLVLAVVEGIPVLIFDPDLETLAGKLITQGTLAITLIGIAFTFAAPAGARFARPQRLGLRRPRPSAVGWTFAALGVYLVFAAVLNALVHTEQEDLARDLGFDVNLFGAIAAGVLIVGVAPISEELFFRGFMFAGLRSRWPLAAAAPLSGAIFGLFHFGPGNLAAVAQLAGLGLILCLLYEKTGSLWPPILLHTVNNAIAFAVLASS